MARGVTIIAIGGKHDPDLAVAIKRYEDRLGAEGGISWSLIPYSGLSGDAARRAESAAIAAKLKDDDVLVVLDERGVACTSEAFSGYLADWHTRPGRVVFVIGGAYGVDEALRGRAHYLMSLSRLVFPHQLVRLILAEQIYRAAMIQRGHPYHH